MGGDWYDLSRTLRGWARDVDLVDEVELVVSELVPTRSSTGRRRCGCSMRMRTSSDHLVLEVEDSAVRLPRRMRPSDDDEHGRGPQLAALLAERRGVWPTRHGKVVWCLFSSR